MVSTLWPSVVHEAPRPAPHTSLHIVDDSGLIFDHKRQSLYAANTCATYIWCCLEEGMSPTEIVRRLERRFSFESEKAKRHFAGVVLDWKSKGLAVTGRDGVAVATLPEPEPTPPLLSGDGAWLDSGADSAAVTGSYDLLDTRFELDFADRELFRITHPLIAHLSSTPPPRDRVRLGLMREGADVVLNVNETDYVSCNALNEVPPMVAASLSYIALQRCSAKYALHAGAMRRGESCILLPGGSGVGKSTLIAALAAEGFTMLADDTVVVEEKRHEIRPIRLGICLKPGSWPSLWRYYPELTTLPIYHRTDGKTVRYVMPPENGRNRDSGEQHRVDLMLFPNYRPGAKTCLRPVGTSTAMARLTQGLYVLDRSLDEEAIERLIDWLSAIPCYDLTYSSIPDVAETLCTLER